MNFPPNGRSPSRSRHEDLVAGPTALFTGLRRIKLCGNDPYLQSNPRRMNEQDPLTSYASPGAAGTARSRSPNPRRCAMG
jgi:hypothetical protein